LQNLALLEIATFGTAPEAGLASLLIFTLSPFAQKADAESVGGRGISAFLTIFSSSDDIR
jgi:hypothetical protein